MSSLHSAQTRNHIAENFVFANATDRAAATGYTLASGDVGKLAYQSDTGTYWRLLTTAPTWARVEGSCLQFAATASATVANTTTETTLIGAGYGTKTLPANALVAGRSVRIRAAGVFGSSGTAATLLIKLKFGSTVILATAATAPANSLTNRYWELDIVLTCRTTGASGSIIGQGLFRSMAAASGNLQGWEMTATAAVTIDTTGTNVIDLTATYGGANAADTITCSNCEIELLS